MRTHIQQWGNSLALRIPRSYALETHVEKGAEVELAIVDGTIVVTPVSSPSYTLEGLLKDVSKKNIHSAISTGPIRGRESW